MDKIFFLSHRTTQAIEQSKEFLDDESLFGSLKIDSNLTREGNMVWGDDDNSDDDRPCGSMVNGMRTMFLL